MSARSRAVLRSVNWFWPAYMRRGYVLDLITRLETRLEGLLTFILTFRTSGISMMAPDMTVQARHLGLYFLALREIGPSAARAAGARR